MLYLPEQNQLPEPESRYATNWELLVTAFQIGLAPLLTIAALSLVGELSSGPRTLPRLNRTLRPAITNTYTPTPEATPEVTATPEPEPTLNFRALK